MDQQGFTPIWGVTGLSDAEQRRVRGGSHRASCFRSAYINYRNSIRSGVSRGDARNNLLNSLSNCSSGNGSG